MLHKKINVLFLLFVFGYSAEGQSVKLKSFIDSYIIEHKFNGSILVQTENKTIYNQSFGLANREFNVPFTNKTRYKICSITKLFTAVLILQLYEEGRIDLTKTIHTYLPNYKGEAGSKVTIHQLLNHTSGMQNTDTVKSLENALKYGIGFYQKPYTADELVNNFCSYPLVNEPGEKFDYNNGDYIVLGKILETIYNKSYEEILNERILKPLTMLNSGLISQDKHVSQLANTYFLRKDLNKIVPDLPAYLQDWYSAGAMYSTTADLLTFVDAIFKLKLIKKTTLDLMLAPGLDNYGYSVWIRDDRGANTKYKRMERYGSILGANAVIFRFLNTNATIIILSNTNLTDLGDFALNIGKAIF